MSSYHTSFNYKDKNSFEEGLIIVAFEPDNGFKDTFLSMDNISDDYYDGTKKFNYGSKYNSSAEVQITLIKKDNTDMSLKEFREYARWLTGARTDSWLDMYVGDILIYSFLGKFLNLEHYKYDGRTIGLRLTFSSVSPWAFSAPQTFDCIIGQALELIEENDEVILAKKNKDDVESEDEISYLGVDDEGVLYVSHLDAGSYFSIEEKNVGMPNYEVIAYIDTAYHTTINNESDDLYTYVDLDIDYINDTCSEISIKNETLDEESIVKNIDNNEIITFSSKQFIMSYGTDADGNRINTNRIFGDDFNFKWPRLAPGINDFSVYGDGEGNAYFTYRYPMKIGDCVIDIDENGNAICD